MPCSRRCGLVGHTHSQLQSESLSQDARRITSGASMILYTSVAIQNLVMQSNLPPRTYVVPNAIEFDEFVLRSRQPHVCCPSTTQLVFE